MASERLPNTVPIPAPEPATPTMAAPAPVNLAVASMSLEMALVRKPQLGISEARGHGAAKLPTLSSVSVSGGFSTTADSGPFTTHHPSGAPRGALDQEGGREKLCTGRHTFSGEEGLWKESCSQFREDRKGR